ncbi:hypothetical protein QBC34DRAFT_216914 [Podospora aff. communis PSN243]|uniref:Methyltransferase type 11 domain-containing protein n=1 Tax=Podospora aff. communis PSN243 TaxID=3040156 RepID=A0AAV9GZI6_9PEZI|nr:hypothetical protein QBC34DRAFT_216914 [Podospora aff. communis PSN243]
MSPRLLGPVRSRSDYTGSKGNRAPAEPSREEDASRRTKRPTGISLPPTRTMAQPRVPSNLPQSLHNRRPSAGEVEKVRGHYQSQSWDSNGSGSSGISGANASLLPGPMASRLPGPGSKGRNILRRKPSGLSQDMTGSRNDSQNSSSNRTSSSLSNARAQTPLDGFSGLQFDRDATQSPLEIGVAQKVEATRTTPHPVTIYPELDRYREVEHQALTGGPGPDIMLYRLATHDLPPPTPLFSGTSSQISGFSGSPSTRFSGSPGPGPYSRDTTPTSISSQSPGLVAPIRIPTAGSRMRQVDSALTRPPLTRRRTDSISNDVDPVSADSRALSVVRESSLTSSSSNSTVREADRKDKDKKKKKKRLSPLPPSPPPRKSSQKSKKSRDEEESPSKSSRDPAQPLMTSPPKSKAPSYSLPRPALAAQTGASVVGKATPPARPSRDGTPDLQSQLGRPIPVIQSNLSSTSLSDRRQSHLLASAPVGRPIFSSPPPDQQSSRSRRPSENEGTAAQARATLSKPESARATRTPSPSISSFKSRFPIFGRRKTAPETVQPEKKEKSVRKGPAAGTGHEGYGRLGSARRRSSNANSGRFIPGTMSSQESLSSSQSFDPFFAERMAPVIIAGGEVVENLNTGAELGRTESNLSAAHRRPSVDSNTSMSSSQEPRFTLWPSPFPRNSVQAPPVRGRRPSDSSDSEALHMKSTLAFRRSSQRPESKDQDRKIPKPILTRAHTQPPSITSHDTSIMSDDSVFGPPSEGTRVGRATENAAAGSGPKKLLRRARSPRKWNFFSRSQSQPAVEAKKADNSKTVAATVKAVQTKPIAFYTMMDSSEQEDGESPDLEEVLREARSLATPAPKPQPKTVEAVGTKRLSAREPPTRKDSSSSIARLKPTTATSVSRPPLSHSSTSTSTSTVRQAPGRPSRLPQVGRIPKVVSARAEQTSPKSFSRPFHRLSMQGPPPALEMQDPDFVAKGPSPPKPSTPTPDLIQDESATTSGTNISVTYSVPQDLALEPNQHDSEFFSFSPRKNSECTTTSSSSSGAVFTYAEATAVVPPPNAPLAEDEIWDEYNDFLADETVRLSTHPASSQKPAALHLSKSPEKHMEPSIESPTVMPTPAQSLAQAIMASRDFPVSSIYSMDMTEQVKNALDSAQNDAAPVNSLKKAADQAKRGSNQSVRQTRYSSSSGTSFGSEDSSPLSQVNLRVGSMTVSKWLTFGHVLFSPVRDELISDVGSLKRPSILVVDGLGNDDWSFYAAETYPAATFFNLSPRAPLPTPDHRSSSSTFPMSPPNHHQIKFASLNEKFPFGPQSITAVVFRFPAAGPELQYRNIISEARRVLKPGGFIELSILDVDLNNMGNRGRRTVRRLKERIHAGAPDTYLGSTSDLLLRLLGRKGFTDIKTCRVGVPVASPIARSSSSEAKRSSTGGSRTRSASKTRKDDRSLPELMNDESPVADESITKMVAKVGRWWYSRCYESVAAPVPFAGTRGGLWNDKPLLSECEEWGSSLKLMVCHARVPDDARVRVASI